MKSKFFHQTVSYVTRYLFLFHDFFLGALTKKLIYKKLSPVFIRTPDIYYQFWLFENLCKIFFAIVISLKLAVSGIKMTLSGLESALLSRFGRRPQRGQSPVEHSGTVCPPRPSQA